MKSFSLVANMIALFMASLSVLALEVALTRIFSVLVWYHFVFAIISTALFGLGLGGLVIHVIVRYFPIGPWISITSVSLFAITVPITIALLMHFPYPTLWIGYILIAIIPFAFAGMSIASIFYQYAEESGKLYFADLIGASLGSILVPTVMGKISPINMALWIGAIDALGALLLQLTFLLGTRVDRTSSDSMSHLKANVGNSPRYRIWPPPEAQKMPGIASWKAQVTLATLGLFVTMFSLYASNSRHLQVNTSLPNYTTKTLFDFLSNPREERKIIWSGWDAFARVDVVEGGDPNIKWIFTDGGAGSAMYKFNGNLKDISFLKDDPSFLSLTWGKRDKVLIIGPGGGLDILISLLGGARDITAVEINTKVVEAVRRFSVFNGGIYDGKTYELDNGVRARVNVVTGDGRSFVRRSRETYDVIYLSLVFTQAAESVGFSLAENYVFTKEAFRDYLKHLSPSGHIILRLHDASDLIKVFTTALSLLREKGETLVQGARHVLIINGHGAQEGGIHLPVLVLKKEAFTEDEIDELRRSFSASGIDERVLIFMPYILERGSFAALINGHVTLEEFIRQAPVNIAPATDDRPFFFNERKGLPKALAVLIWTVLLLITVFFILALGHGRIKPSITGRTLGTFGFHFTALALGFIMIEVVLIQRYTLFLGHPTMATSVVIFSLLLGGAIGSLACSKIKVNGHIILTAEKVSLGLALISIVYSLGLPPLFERLLTLSLNQRILTGIGLTLPLGVLMGMPFPLGMRLLSQISPDDVAFMWAANGAFSVLGSVLAVAIAISWGFTWAALAGAAAYILASGNIRVLSTVPDGKYRIKDRNKEIRGLSRKGTVST